MVHIHEFNTPETIQSVEVTHHCKIPNRGRGLCYRKEQTFCGLKGLLLEDIPVRRGSCWAFWRQNCCKSAAAWDTLTLLMPASSRSCSTTFFIATMLEEPDMVQCIFNTLCYSIKSYLKLIRSECYSRLMLTC